LSQQLVRVDRTLYPFSGHFFDVGGAALHYLDEGRGEPVVMLHGNPTWSFMYRNLIGALSDRHRCIAPDHIGCGLSDKPPAVNYDYSLARRVSDLTALLEYVGATSNVTVIVHDWGGMIGMAWATRFPERVKRLVVLNTAAFPMPAKARMPRSLWWGRNTAVGALLIRGPNAFCRLAARWCVTKPLSPEVRRMYLAPYDSWAHRISVLRFVQTIPLSERDPGFEIVRETGERLHLLSEKPMLICWGMRDFVFDHHFLAEWQLRFPSAGVHRFPEAGHYLLEDAGEHVVERVREFTRRS
jgi:haloalkane dehalogenase